MIVVKALLFDVFSEFDLSDVRVRDTHQEGDYCPQKGRQELEIVANLRKFFTLVTFFSALSKIGLFEMGKTNRFTSSFL